MDSAAAASVENLQSKDRKVMSEAFLYLQKVTDEKVDWAYEVWDRLKDDLKHPDNHRRAISAQLLCNLAKSDPEGRIVQVFPALLEVTKDPRFVTARHCLLSLWKIGLTGPDRKKMLLDGLAERYRNCTDEKNCTLIRFDIVQSLRKLYDHEPDEGVKQLALELIQIEDDLKYRKKYAAVWKKA